MIQRTLEYEKNQNLYKEIIDLYTNKDLED